MTRRIVVLGAGYAGLTAAKRLARLLPGTARVTLVNARERFFERVRFHQLATGQELGSPLLADVLAGTGVDPVVARVTAVEPEVRRVVLDAEPYELHYDTLVYALGSGVDVDTVPGAREHAFTVGDAGQATSLSTHLAGTVAGADVAVVGGGLTGIETVTELAEARPGLRYTLVTADHAGGWLSAKAQRYLHRAFTRRGIDVYEEAPVAEVSASGLLLADGRHLPADTVVWTAGFTVPTVAAAAGLAVDGHGRMLVDSTLCSVSHPDVYGVGDAAAARTPNGEESRMSCQTGLPMGMYAAGTVARRLAGRDRDPIRIRYVAQNISLGRKDGVIQFTRADDTPVGAVLTGRTAARFKETITRGSALAARRPGPYLPFRRKRVAEQAGSTDRLPDADASLSRADADHAVRRAG